MFRPRNAVATSFWGVPRTTQDADCLVAVPAIAYQRLAGAHEMTRAARAADEAARMRHTDGADSRRPIQP